MCDYLPKWLYFLVGKRNPYFNILSISWGKYGYFRIWWHVSKKKLTFFFHVFISFFLST